MKLKEPNTDDLQSISECRRMVFPDSVASKMGRWYLVKIFKMFVISPYHFIYFIEKNNICVGYCTGSLGTIKTTGLGATSTMIHYAFWEGVLSLMVRPWLLFDKSIVKKWKFIIQKLFERVKKIFCGKYYVIEKKNSSEEAVWIVDIGVHPEYRRLGIASKLLVEFDNRVKNLGILKGGLSVKKSNLGAIKVYNKHGWNIHETRSSSYFMIKDYR